MLGTPPTARGRSGRAAAAALVCLASACAPPQLASDLAAAYAPENDAVLLDLADDPAEPPALERVPVDLSDGVTPTEAALVAVVQNPELRAERDRLMLEGVALIEAGVLPSPELSADVTAPLAGGAGDETVATSVGLSWEVTGGRGRSDRYAAAHAEGRAVRLDVAWQEWGVAQEARLTALDWLAESDQRAALAAHREALRGRAERVDAWVLVGLAPRPWDEQLAVDRLGVEESLTALDAQLLETDDHLRSLLGLTPDTPLRVVPEPTEPRVPPLDDLLRDLPERRLDLRALADLREASDARLRSAMAQRFPPITLSVSAERDNAGLYSAGLGVAVALPGRRARDLESTRESVSRHQLDDELAARTAQARADVTALYNALAAWEPRRAVAQAQLDHGEDRLVRYQRLVDSGLVTWPDLAAQVDARQDAELRLLELDHDIARARVALEIASGRLFGGSSEGGP